MGESGLPIVTVKITANVKLLTEKKVFLTQRRSSGRDVFPLDLLYEGGPFDAKEFGCLLFISP